MADYRGTIREAGEKLARLANGDRESVGAPLGFGYRNEILKDGSERLYFHGTLVGTTPAPTRRIELPLPEREV